MDPGLDGGVLCDLAMDADSDVIDVVLSHLASEPEMGIDIDGRKNQSTAQGGLGATIEGCGRLDAAGGVDNGFGAVLFAMRNAVDFRPEISASVVTSPPGTGVIGKMQVRVRITHVAAGQPTNDPCVGVELHVDRGSGPAVVTTHGALTNDVVTAHFGTMQVPLRFGLSATAIGCDGACAPGDLDLVARQVHVRLALDTTHTRLEPGSRIAGVFFDTAPGDEYASMSASGMSAALAEWGAETHLSGSFRTMLVVAFSTYRDSYLRWTGDLAPCVSTVDPPSAQHTNRNATSFGFAVDSLP